MINRKLITALVCAALLSLDALGAARWPEDRGAIGTPSATVKFSGRIEVGFSPGEGAQELVTKVIDSARREVRVLAYSFTSAEVVNALLAARKRGVDVQVVVDYRNNIAEDRSQKARAALSALANAGIPVRTVSVWAIQHSKTIVVDRAHVETGSFNYSSAAAKRNSENVMVVWDSPDLAAVYLKHWESRFARGEPYRTTY